MGGAAEVQSVAMATGAAGADHDHVGVLGVGSGEQLLTGVTLEQQLTERHLRITRGSAPLVEPLRSHPAPRLDFGVRDVEEEARLPHGRDDELATFRVRQAQRPTQGGLGADGPIRSNQDAHRASLRSRSSRPPRRISG